MRSGLSRVRLDVIDTNPRARALYERNGFQAIETDEFGPFEHLFGFSSATRMEKQLSLLDVDYEIAGSLLPKRDNQESSMSSHGYEGGRLNLPFVGICTFGKYPYQQDWDAIDADVAVLGAPFDFGTQWRSGARMGQELSGRRRRCSLLAMPGPMDFEDDVTYLPAETTRIVDIGDADIVHTDTIESHKRIEFGVRKILEAGALPVVLGGDHSINIPCINAL